MLHTAKSESWEHSSNTNSCLMVVDKGMTHGSSILAYFVFGPGRTSVEGMARPISTTVWRGPGASLGMQCKNSKEQDLVELGLELGFSCTAFVHS
jgi:hypothetical protein